MSIAKLWEARHAKRAELRYRAKLAILQSNPPAGSRAAVIDAVMRISNSILEAKIKDDMPGTISLTIVIAEADHYLQSDIANRCEASIRQIIAVGTQLRLTIEEV
jgi:hypothetical protein